MPQIVFGPQPQATLDGAAPKAAYAFLAQLQQDDTVPGLHIEPINGTKDSRVRTGRVSDFWRAVLVKVQGQQSEAHYVYLGTYPHDDAIAFAKKVTLEINPRNGIAELILADEQSAPPAVETELVSASVEKAVDETPAERFPLLSAWDITAETLESLGIEPRIARRAVTARTEDEVMALVEHAPAEWQGLALLDLATGTPLDEVRAKLGIGATTETSGEDDDDLLTALQHPAARLEFAFIEDDADLRAAIESTDFGRWRVFLHPEQRRYAVGDWNGPYRLSGGAGTGKTVVLLHRARHLAKQDPTSRIVLTTFNKTLAASLEENLRLLDPELTIAQKLGEPGIVVANVDALARRVLASAESRIGSSEHGPGAVAKVLGERSPHVLEPTAKAAWDTAAGAAQSALPAELRTEAFLATEYETVILPNRVTTREAYLRVRRPGRGVALDRARRNAIWDVVEAFRSAAAAAGTTHFDEKAMIAATYLDERADSGEGRLADHVLVDEGQDLGPTRLKFLRALVAPGRNDVFLAEDSQQRIYGQRIVLSKYDINVRGRSRRLTLNYRTTAQVLQFAVGVLQNAEFVDMDAEAATSAGYRSARSGPVPVAVEASSLVDEYEKAAQIVRGWTTDDAAPEPPGILVYTKWAAETLQRALLERGVETRFVANDSPAEKGKPVIMTMHRSKGMEFKRVLLFGLSADSVPGMHHLEKLPEAEKQDALLRERSLLYVASTRARDELAVLWSGERSELLPTMQDGRSEEQG